MPNLVDNVAFGTLKTATDFVLAFVSIFDEENPLGTIAAVESGVVLMVIVVVEELRVAQVTEHVTGNAPVLTSSAWITTSGLNLLSAGKVNKIIILHRINNEYISSIIF